MKNEDRILELLAETLQRIDQHSEQFVRVQEEMKLQREEAKLQQEQMKSQQEQMKSQQEEMKLQQEEMKFQRGEISTQREVMLALLKKIQQHDDRLDRHSGSLSALRERTEAIHQSALEQQKAYREMTELLMFHNKALREKNIL